MLKNIPEEIVEQIRARADVVDVIGQYVDLTRKGKNYSGLCPFHNEKTPSFSVNKEKQMYYCFGCGAGGDAFSFIMAKERLTFPETLEKLAKQYRVELPQEEMSPEQMLRIKKKQRLVELNQLAAKYYNYLLSQPMGKEAKAYLLSRGMTELEITKYQLGFAPATWDSFYRVATDRGYSKEELLEAGLITSKENSSHCYDRFRNRVIFTIYNHFSEAVGFGGRVLDQSLPKYLNTPETILFSKGRSLYGLNWAGSSIREQGFVIVMEGYMDAIAAYQHNIENVVASLGTAFTKEHATLLKRYSNQVVICYDSDIAGEKAALRGMGILQEEQCDVRVALLPKGMDPDDFLRSEGSAAFGQLIKNAQSYMEYKLSRIIANTDQNVPSWQVKAFTAIKGDLLKITNAIEIEQHIKMVASKLVVPENSIREELNKSYRKKTGINRDKKDEIRDTINGSESGITARGSSAQEKAERQLFFFMISDEGLRQQVVQALGEDFFTLSFFKKLYSAARDRWAQGKKVDIGWLMTICSNEEEVKLLARIFNDMLPEDKKMVDKTIQDCIQAIINKNNKSLLKDLQSRLREAEAAGDIASVKKILTEMQRLMR